MQWSWKTWALIGLGLAAFAGGAIVADSSAVDKLADAIAFAEGFYVAGSRPQRDNNPGDIEADLIGKAIGWDGPFPIYATAADGWNNLKTQVAAMLNNTSMVYNNGMTIAQVAAQYTATDVAAWANNVATRLGVSVSTQIGSIG